MSLPLENFDSYSVGDLTGENGGTGWSAAWTGNTAFDVTTAQAQSGANSVVVLAAQDPEATISRAWTTGETSGIYQYYMRRKGGNNWRDGLYFDLKEGANVRGGTIFKVTNTSTGAVGAQIYAVGGSSEVFESGTLFADTWHKIDLEFDCTTDQFRARVDDGTWSSWISFTASTTIDGINFTKGNINGGTYNITTDHFVDSLIDQADAGVVSQDSNFFLLMKTQ